MINIRKMVGADRREVFEMMREFYASPAILVKSPDKVLLKDIDDAIGDCPYLEGFIFESDGMIAGYSMTSTGYSTEYGGIAIWIEDLFVKEEYRGLGITKAFFPFLLSYYPTAARFRLEVEEENEKAIRAYQHNGFHKVPYVLMSREV